MHHYFFIISFLYYSKYVIRPKYKDYYDIIASVQLLSAFLSASCFHLRFDIARYAFNAGCRNMFETNTKKIYNLMTDWGIIMFCVRMIVFLFFFVEPNLYFSFFFLLFSFVKFMHCVSESVALCYSLGVFG